MLLPYILDQLDAEVGRLVRLRAVVASLQSPFTVPQIAEVTSSPEESPAAQIAAQATAQDSAQDGAPDELRLPRTPRRPRVARAGAYKPRRDKSTPSPTPEAGNLPLKPAAPRMVVVSAQELERERARREVRRGPVPGERATPEVHEEPAPESVARSLAARWLSGTKPDGQLPAA